MLRVCKLTDYASVILAYRASHPQQRFSAASLAEAVLLPQATVSKLLKLLAKDGLLKASRGKQGGYALARPARQISVAEIVCALEGPIALTECCINKDLCRLEQNCDVCTGWKGINLAIYNTLASTTLDKLLGMQAKPKVT